MRGFTPEATETLCGFAWPGNVRQLRNTIVASMAVLGGDVIDLATLSRFIEGDEEALPDADDRGESLDYGDSVEQFERRYMIRLLRSCEGNVEEAAARSGMNLATVYRKIKKYGLRRSEFT